MAFCSKVMSIPELREMILLHLPPLDLLHVQSICGAWRDAVQSSPKAQQALFLQPYPSIVLVEKRRNWRAADKDNDDAERSWRTETGNQVRHPPLWNPFLNAFTFTAKHPRVGLNHSGFVSPVQLWDPVQRERADDGTVALHSREASLHLMLPMQPAPRTIRIKCLEEQLRERDVWYHTVAEDEDDFVRIGDVKEVLGSHWIFCPNCPIYPDEGNRWHFEGDDDIEMIAEDSTGWKVLEERKRRSEVL